MAQVIYVSGRKRETGEMNGKSGNINNCCAQIYPRGVKIPSNELVCIFDADQARPWQRVLAEASSPCCTSDIRLSIFPGQTARQAQLTISSAPPHPMN